MLPVIILTGFLGSGKTTVLNQLLAVRAATGATGKLGIIVNELGDIGVDGALLPPGASRQVELPGGCVCCVLSDDLAKTMLELIEQTPGIEAIVLETTGAAEPLPLAWAMESPPLCDKVRLAAVLAVVDAEGFVAARQLSPAVDAQVASADLVLLSKEDLTSPNARAETLAAISSLAPRVEVRSGGAAAHAVWLAAVLAEPSLELRAHPAKPHDHDHDHDRPVPSPEHLLDSVGAYLPDRLVDLEELEDHLAALPAHYVRIKGITRAIDGRRGHSDIDWYAFHRVGLRVSSEPLSHSASPRVVALGREVDIAMVLACIEKSVVPP